VYLRYPLRVRDRDQLLEAAREQKIELGDWFNAPLHPDIRQSPALGFNPGTCPNAEHAAKEVINLPTHTRVNRQEAERILDFLEQNKGLLQ
jgi:dTDP-4-amino-4,6-dideoxygalactose transaminase